MLYLETNDAGALFRFTDIYPRMIGGKMWIGMDPPTQDASPQDGVINVRDFTDPRRERARPRGARARRTARSSAATRIDFSQARADFTRAPGRMTIRDGVVRGPMIGATIEGNIDYARDQVHVRGTLVPLYGLNNMFGQIPIVGLFLGGGSNEGIFGITYEVTGPTSESAAGGQSDLGDRAGRAAQVLRIPRSQPRIARSPSRRRADARYRALTSGLIRTCRFLAERQLDHAVAASRSLPAITIFLVGDGHVVDLQTAALDLTRRASPFELARPSLHEGREDAEPANLGTRHRNASAASGAVSPSSKVVRAVSGGFVGRRAAVHQRGRLGGEHLLGLVDLGALERREPADLVERQHREQLEEAGDVAVLGVAPVLPVVVGAHQVGVEPDRAGRGLAHLGAGDWW